MPLLDLAGINRTFTLPTGERLEILRDINLRVEAGEHVAIVGRSGTGKSTLLNILGLLDAPTAGNYTFAGQDTTRWSDQRRARTRGRNFGFVFQSFNLLPGLGVIDNVAAPLLYATDAAFFTRRRRAIELLQKMGLGERLESRLDQLSGGEQQRVALARALVRHPRVILADEPTGALDVETGTHVMNMMEEAAAASNAALLVITHDPAIAARAHTHYSLGDGVLTPISLTAGAPARQQVSSALAASAPTGPGLLPSPEVTI
ncbi:ABC transporter ATP-binding protein [Buchananella hordeovulneris]|uniref:ABC transporter ATP-binding protein n=1 Tax=Buchananella hordeovulneris TaxID=52770 RepID=UPI000F5D5D14|nr:ABC transporter ATP-binding protein [Buchananella hordeovulneris]RRD43585.1 ABC transporter ATP-binding protein [Buchananella hordeovulneris]